MTAPSLLVDLRPCYEGFAGIPQETRLLFDLFADMGLRLGGLTSGIHHAGRMASRADPFAATLEQTRLLIAQDSRRHDAPILSALLPARLRARAHHVIGVLGYAGRSETLAHRIDPVLFEDFLWTRLFERTLPAARRDILRRAEFIPTTLGHENARSLSLLPRAASRRLDTAGWDVFLCATVSPYRVRPTTSMIVRYYDALPLLSPHTIGEAWPHANSHARMLARNMADGAHFYCDSEPVRSDLLRLFPRAERRVRVIPCVVSPSFFPDTKPRAELASILRRRASAAASLGTSPDAAPKSPLTRTEPPPRLILAVSTVEPRKNYARLFEAFARARERAARPVALVVVGGRGWRSETEHGHLAALARDGNHHLVDVSAAELRVLYSMAHLVVAPSRAEGFDYSGVEAMACGTPVLASDIAVHRWVYGDAAEYFDPYDEAALADRLTAFAELPRETGRLADLRARGFRQAALYRPEALAPCWEQAVVDAAATARQAARSLAAPALRPGPIPVRMPWRARPGEATMAR